MKLEVETYPVEESLDKKQGVKTPSKISKWVKRVAHYSNIEMLSFAHSNKLVVWFIVFWTTLLQIGLLRFEIEPGNHKFRLHSFFKYELSDYIDFSGWRRDLEMTDDYTILAIFGFVVFKFIWICGTIYCKLQGYFQGPVIIFFGKLVGFFVLCDSTIFLVIKISVICSTLQSASGGLKFVAVLAFLLEAINFLFHLNFSRDPRYLKKNRFQGKSYTYYSAKTISLMVLIVFSFTLTDKSTKAAKAFFNFANALVALALLSFQIKTGVFSQFSLFSMHALLDGFFFWESIIAFLSIVSKAVATSDLDFFSFIGVSCIFACIKIYSNRFEERYLFTKFNSIQHGNTARLFIFSMYQCFLKSQNDKQKELMLFSALGRHLEQCKNPYCLCFLSKVYFKEDNEQKPNTSLQAILEKNYKRIDRRSVSNSIAIFKELDVINNLKSTHLRIAQAEEQEDDTMPGSDIDREEPSPDMIYLLNLKSKLQMCRILCSFFVQLIDQVKKSVSSLYFEMISFFLFEYQNYMAALISLYQAAGSLKFKKSASLLNQVMLLNFIDIAKQKLKFSLESTIDPLSPKIDIYKVLKYKEDVTRLQANNRKLLCKKLDFYLELSSFEIDYKQLVNIGQEINAGVVENRFLVKELMSISQKNPKLINEAIFFELCVLEKPTISKGTKKAYTEYKNDGRFERPNQRAQRSKEKVNYYNSSHAVLFVSCLDHFFRVSKMSSNAPGFFKVQKHQLIGLPIKNLMPKTIGVHHDDFLFHFINGTSSSKAHLIVESASVLGSRKK